MNRKTFNQYIIEADFRSLFVSEMGWNNPTGAISLPEYSIDEQTLNITQIADRNGFQILHCEIDHIPTSSFCKKLDTRLRRNANDYILIFSTPMEIHHLWVVPVKKVEKRDLVMVEYTSVEQTEFLYQKVEGLSFDLDEQTTISDVIARVQEAFLINSEKLTKDFYTGFKKEHTHFAKFISGIDDQIDDKQNRNKQWYTSVMLNRLMFCYFIQKKGFLDGDVDYLKHKLEWTQHERGEDRFFHTFYKGFLITLFHGGLNAPKHGDEFENVYGRIPYLNGGMFDEHQIERDYADLDIADEAFESLFDFFDKWNWHLDDRITASGRDINPDVLGYIFEQYINDRAQMGAYYTKEDITEYIGRNTIVPHLMEQTLSAEKSSSVKDFWMSLQQSGDRYIYDAVKRGVHLPLPDYIEQGIDTSKPNLLERRARWNERAFEEYALPTEIWRETVERRQRYADIRGRIEHGELSSANDFITYNLDIRQFVYDYLLHTDNHLFIKHFYHALQHVTILDPTCGSGAFLFAALNILEPLYEVCISRMQGFAGQNDKLFREELAEIEHRYRSNIQYFIYKSIILRNLYGVDIMVEATEIAKLRLFLKMVAVVDVNPRDPNLGLDPLPDIDFNIRCGNTLVGYATEKELERDLIEGDMFAAAEFRDKVHNEMDIVARTFLRFKEVQLTQDEDLATFKNAKKELRDRLNKLNETLNKKLYQSTTEKHTYHQWLTTHQPFHWLAEFYEIIHDHGGFDVIIGNPPYVVCTIEKKQREALSNGYKIKYYRTIECANLYAYVLERTLNIAQLAMKIGMIIPLSFTAAKNMSSLRELLTSNKATFVSSFEIRPAKLFDGGKGADQRLNIVISNGNCKEILYTTEVLRWSSEHRRFLFNNIGYTLSVIKNRIIRLSNPVELNILSKYEKDKPIEYLCANYNTEYKVCYRSAGLRYWIIFLNDGFNTTSASNKYKYVVGLKESKYLMAGLNSNIYWWYYATNYDMFNQTDSNVSNFRLSYDPQNDIGIFASELEDDLNRNKKYSKITKRDGSINESYAFQKKLSKPIIDEIDKVLAKHYGFTEEELDFIINYDIKYRMGDELNEE